MHARLTSNLSVQAERVFKAERARPRPASGYLAAKGELARDLMDEVRNGAHVPEVDAEMPMRDPSPLPAVVPSAPAPAPMPVPVPVRAREPEPEPEPEPEMEEDLVDEEVWCSGRGLLSCAHRVVEASAGARLMLMCCCATHAG
jgi:hypothetical protein